jgi:hypothetical protein
MDLDRQHLEPESHGHAAAQIPAFGKAEEF